MHIYAIVGAGGFGREVMPVAREMLAQRSTEPYRLVFVDDGDITGPVNGHDVLTTEAFFALDASQRYSMSRLAVVQRESSWRSA